MKACKLYKCIFVAITTMCIAAIGSCDSHPFSSNNIYHDISQAAINSQLKDVETKHHLVRLSDKVAAAKLKGEEKYNLLITLINIAAVNNVINSQDGEMKKMPAFNYISSKFLSSSSQVVNIKDFEDSMLNKESAIVSIAATHTQQVPYKALPDQFNKIEFSHREERALNNLIRFRNFLIGRLESPDNIKKMEIRKSDGKYLDTYKSIISDLSSFAELNHWNEELPF